MDQRIRRSFRTFFLAWLIPGFVLGMEEFTWEQILECMEKQSPISIHISNDSAFIEVINDLVNRNNNGVWNRKICWIDVEATDDHLQLYVTIDVRSARCSDENYVAVFESVPEESEAQNSEVPQRTWCREGSDISLPYLSQTKHVRLAIYFGDQDADVYIAVSIGSLHPELYRVSILPESEMNGYVRGTLIDDTSLHMLDVYEGQLNIDVPPDHIAMLSIFPLPVYVQELSVYTNNLTANNRMLSVGKSFSSVSLSHMPAVYEARVLRLRFVVEERLAQRCHNCTIIFTYFSFHKKSEAPHLLPLNLWNCSVPWFDNFKQHLGLCDLVTECYSGEDEMDCGYNVCTPRGFLVHDRCYLLLRARRSLTHTKAQDICAEHGARLATLNTEPKWTGFFHVLGQFELPYVFSIGLSSTGLKFSIRYRIAHQWSDDTICFSPIVNIDRHSERFDRHFGGRVCGWGRVLGRDQNPYIFTSICAKQQPAAYPMCELGHIHTSSINSRLLVSRMPSKIELSRCPNNHTIHSFLACDIETKCFASGLELYGMTRESWDIPLVSSCAATMTSLPPSFACQRGLQRVPYSLVCDYQRDCQDNSDEDFCQYPACPTATHRQCNNKQCITRKEWCDAALHCFDGSDEESCLYSTYKVGSATVFEEWRQRVDFHALNQIPLSDPENFNPETHIICPDSELQLAVYFLCNGVYDCPGKEDEQGCDNYICDGYYRCRSSTVCVHHNSVCDGFAHCPQFDDEAFCDLHCPQPNCTCRGHAFTCASPFQAVLYPQLRYLNAEGSGMKPNMLLNNSLLIHLSLADCGLTSLEKLNLPNLKSLDISNNLMQTIISIDNLTDHLSALFLADNPLTSVFTPSDLTLSLNVPDLQILDLSFIKMRKFDAHILTRFSNLQNLNLSHCGVERISNSFSFLKELKRLDVRGCPMVKFSKHLLKFSTNLEQVFTDTYRLCCLDVLPKDFNPSQCHSPRDRLSTCESLLGSKVYIYLIVIYTVLTILGNATSFVYRVLIKKSYNLSSYAVIVTHLSVSDFISGLHLAIIVTVDRLHFGGYLWEDSTWRHSACCQLAGMLNTMSREVSAFFIAIITIDRCLALCFPQHHTHMSIRSVHLACAVAWMIGAVLSFLPLFQSTSTLSYTHSGFCALLLDSDSQHLSSIREITGVLRLLLTIIVVAGQIYVQSRIRADPLSFLRATHMSHELTIARRLFPICITSCLCQLSLSASLLVVPENPHTFQDINVMMMVFLMPLISVLNPFLYAYRIWLERKRTISRQRLLQRLKGKEQIA